MNSYGKAILRVIILAIFYSIANVQLGCFSEDDDDDDVGREFQVTATLEALVPNDQNGKIDVYRFYETGNGKRVYELVSVNPQGFSGDGDSTLGVTKYQGNKRTQARFYWNPSPVSILRQPKITADGRYVVFCSKATDLAGTSVEMDQPEESYTPPTYTPPSYTPPTGDVEGTTPESMYMYTPPGEGTVTGGSAFSSQPTTSSASSTGAPVSQPTGSSLNSTTSPATQAASTAGEGVESGGTSLSPQLNGQYFQVFIRDMKTGTTTLVSQFNGSGANEDCFDPILEDLEGKWIAFISKSSNLNNLGNNGCDQVFFSKGKGSLETASRNGSGLATGDCYDLELMIEYDEDPRERGYPLEINVLRFASPDGNLLLGSPSKGNTTRQNLVGKNARNDYQYRVPVTQIQ